MAKNSERESKTKAGKESLAYQAIAIDLPIQAIEALKAMHRMGIYGATIEEVAERIICRQLESMIVRR